MADWYRFPFVLSSLRSRRIDGLPGKTQTVLRLLPSFDTAYGLLRTNGDESLRR